MESERDIPRAVEHIDSVDAAMATNDNLIFHC